MLLLLAKVASFAAAVALTDRPNEPIIRPVWVNWWWLSNVSVCVCVWANITCLFHFISFIHSFVQSVIAVMCVCVIVGQYVIRLVVVMSFAVL